MANSIAAKIDVEKEIEAHDPDGRTPEEQPRVLTFRIVRLEKNDPDMTLCGCRCISYCSCDCDRGGLVS